MRGAAEHYYCFLPALREQLIPNTTGKPYCYKLITIKLAYIITTHVTGIESNPTVHLVCNALNLYKAKPVAVVYTVMPTQVPEVQPEPSTTVRRA